MRLQKKRTAEQFIAGADQINSLNELQSLSLDELAVRASSIITQSKQMLARILYAGRKQCKSNKEYGQWVSSIIGLSDITFQHRNAMLNWAKFEENHPMDGISMTAGFEIAEPGNADIAEKAYEYCYNKNLPVAEVKRYIMELKSINSTANQVIEWKSVNESAPPPSQATAVQISNSDNQSSSNMLEQNINDYEYETAIEKLCNELGMSDESVIRVLKHIIDKKQSYLHE